MNKIKPIAGQSVLELATADKALGKVVNLNVAIEPKSESETDLLADAFFNLYKRDPRLVEEPPSGREVNHSVLRFAETQEGFQSLREKASGNLPVCLTSAPIYWSALMADDTIQKALEAQKDAEEKQQQAEQAQKDADKAQQQAEQNPQDEQAQQAAQAAQESAEKAQQDAQAAAQLAEKLSDKIGNNPMSKAAFTSAANKAEQQADETDAFMKGWGIDPADVAYDEAAQIVNAASSDASQRISEVLGRLQGIANKTIRANMQPPEGAPSEVKLTRDIERLFPDELVSLNQRNPRVLRVNKLRRLTTTGLIGWMPPQTPKKAGNFTAYVDVSTSMSGDDVRTATAIAIAIAKATRDVNSDRTYSLKLFNTRVLHNATITNEDDWRAHLRFASARATGNTSFHEIVEEVVSAMENSVNDESGKFEDVLVITDGGAGEIDEDMAVRLETAKETSGSRFFYVQIGYDYHSPHQKRSLRSLANIQVKFRDGEGFMAGVDQLAEDICEQLANQV